MSKAIPDRWLKYQPIGQRVPSTRFIAFKVPLSQNVNSRVDEELRLAPHSLLESVPNLGLIVDLTNTNRYYNPRDFTNQNVEHQKLMIPGHQTPPKELAQRFCGYVTNFLEANADNDKLIGVHCTHGVNRTGYLICYFMITNLKMSPLEAMKTFADARGHRIERENYTNSLLNLIQNQNPTHIKFKEEDDNTRKVQQTSNPEENLWIMQYAQKKEKQQSETRDNVWRQDQNSWQQPCQEMEEYQQRQQQRQMRYQPQQQEHPQQWYNRNRAYGHEERSQYRPQHRWQHNEFAPSEYRSRHYDNNNQRPDHHPRSQYQSRQRNQRDDYRRNNNYDSYSRNAYSNRNNYRRNNYNHRQEEYYTNNQ